MADLTTREHLNAPCFNFDKRPKGFALIPEDVEFNPAVHLQLEPSEKILSLNDLGYTDDEIDAMNLPSRMAVAFPFRVLSDEGVRVLNRITAALERHAMKGTRTAKVQRGSVYRSKFMRGLCTSPEFTAHVARMAGCSVVGHPMSLQQGQINYKPKKDTGKPVDRWHVDSTPFVAVLFNNDPATYEGGRFQFFNGTKAEGMALLDDHNGQLPADRIINLPHQKPGYAVFQQGPGVVHRATKVTKGEERISVVQSFVATDPSKFAGAANMATCYGSDFDPLHVFMTDWVRYRAWAASLHLSSALHPSSLSHLPNALVTNNDDEVLESNTRRVVSVLKKLDRAVGAPFTDSRPVLLSVVDEALVPLTSLVEQANPTSPLYKRAAAARDVLSLARQDVATFERAAMPSKL